MSKADIAVQGDIGPMTESLGVVDLLYIADNKYFSNDATVIFTAKMKIY